MAIPVIDTTQSVLSYQQWQPQSFQASATNAPTSWSISPAAPPGMTLNTATGLLSGALTQVGVFNFQLIATNASGDSTPAVFTMAGYYGAAPMDPIIPTVYVDMATRSVTASYDGTHPTLPLSSTSGVAGTDIISPAVSNSGSGSGSGSSTPTAPVISPILGFKYGDDAILKVVFYTQQSGNAYNQMDATLQGLTFAVKDVDSNVVLTGNGGMNWKKVIYVQNDMQYSYHLIYFSLTDPSLQAALLNVQNDAGTSFIGEGELQWIVSADFGVGPTFLTNSSITFPVKVTLDVAA